MFNAYFPAFFRLILEGNNQNKLIAKTNQSTLGKAEESYQNLNHRSSILICSARPNKLPAPARIETLLSEQTPIIYGGSHEIR